LLPALFFALMFPLIATQPTYSATIDTVNKEICDKAEENGGELPTICDPDAVNNAQTSSDNILVGPQGMITRLTKVMIWVSGTLAMIMIIISGLMFIFSSGNPESAGRARRTLMYALIGMVVAVVGQLIVSFVLNKL